MVFDKVSTESGQKKRKRRFTRLTVTPEEASRTARRRKNDTAGEDGTVCSTALRTRTGHVIARTLLGPEVRAPTATAL